MANEPNYKHTGLTTAKVAGKSAKWDGTNVVTGLLWDGSGNMILGQTTVDPTGITLAGYAKGCMLIKTDVAAATGGMYLNKGTTAVASFSLVTQA